MTETTTTQDEQRDEDTAPADQRDETQGTTPEQPGDEAQDTEQREDGEQDEQSTPLEKQLAKARREAAERRVTAREATERAEALQAELDTARGDLDRFKQGMARDIVQRGMSVTFDAFTAAGHTLEDLTDEDGKPDPEKIRTLDDDLGEKYGRTRSGNFGGISAVEAARALADRYTNPFTGNTAGGSTWGDVLTK
ncbi:hypothetical protein NUV30_04650 [Kocuria rhizophila]|uniref:hypothetical protein n=1 Tax=Kocuria rhizophila TaxID=72000 RepID=UPI0021502D43|nr:hypothetical protein [Kocuria rhizophila]MCR4525672.1 hypothetical protein [Kocuria rhizophila]MCT1917730.1 hypothetical protein [Kocuria rhizophila]